MDVKHNIFSGISIVFLIFIVGAIAGFLAGEYFSDADGPFFSLFEKKGEVGLDKVSDGPYIFWRDPGHAIAFYICDGDLITREFQAFDTVRFAGFCHDSTVTYKIPVKDYRVENEVYDNISRIFAISDIHGEYNYMIDILKKGGVIDEHDNWIFGDGHLVINGDIVDRGDAVTECLWFVHSLEREAARAGGKVHFLLGNHELMVIQGDLRYVHKKYSAGIAKKSRISYDRLFGPLTEFGRWLSKKNTTVRINDILFVHGGVSVDLIDRYENFERINNVVRDNIGILPYNKVLGEDEMFVYRSMGPVWYRGLLMEHDYPMVTSSQLDELLDFFDASAFVVGHTLMDRVDSYFDGKVFSLGVSPAELSSLEALLWQDGVFYRVKGDGGKEILIN
jgi:hypothetical protein